MATKRKHSYARQSGGPWHRLADPVSFTTYDEPTRTLCSRTIAPVDYAKYWPQGMCRDCDRAMRK